jgi:hypothetical protein
MINCANRLNLRVFAGVHCDSDAMVVQDYAREHELFWATNDPSAKFNKALFLAYEAGYDHFVIMGDDDSVSKEVLGDYDHAGFSRNHYVDTRTGSVGLHDYTRKHSYPKVIGAGRVLSRKVVEDTCFDVRAEVIRDHDDPFLRFKVGSVHSWNMNTAKMFEQLGVVKIISTNYIGLWPSNLKRGMDWRADYRLIASGYIPYLIDKHYQRVHVTDVKSSVNIWPYSILEKDLSDATINDATWFMDEDEKEYLLSLMKH